MIFLCRHCFRKVPVQGHVFWCKCGKTWVSRKIDTVQ